MYYSKQFYENVFILFLYVVIILFIYLIPTIVSSKRKCEDKKGIIVLNVFLGWTFIGWVIALIWAVIGQEKEDKPWKS